MSLFSENNLDNSKDEPPEIEFIYDSEVWQLWFETPMPGLIQKLLQNHELLSHPYVFSFKDRDNEEYEIESFIMLCKDTLWLKSRFDRKWPFGNDGFGNYYLVDPENTDADIEFYDHEHDEITSIPSSLSQLLQSLKSKRNGG